MSNAYTSPIWTPERVATLERLWREGKSAGEIGKLFDVSRSAVIGKVHRLGMSATDGGKARNQGGSNNRRPPFKAGARIVTPAPSVRSCGRPWLTRRRGECAWPVGGEGADTLSCCAPTLDGETYCQAHLAIRNNPKPWGFYKGGEKELAKALRKFVA